MEEQFEQAASYLRGIAGKLDNADLLYFYARFKQVREGPNKTPKPSFFDFTGKQKWAAWAALEDMGAEQAMEEYVTRLGELEPEWEGQTPAEERSWVSVSAMSPPDEPQIPDDSKTVFDWALEGNVERIRDEFVRDPTIKTALDQKGMGVIHWLTDRGHEEALNDLVSELDVDLRDSEGQTALHYAASCDHVAMAQILVKSGADKSLRDNDDLTPIDAHDDGNAAMKDLLSI